ncbi:MAG: hypothetical protein ACRDCW_15095 [Sarcina sp.]
MNLIPIIIILILVLKGAIQGKQKKVKPIKIILIPALFIYYIYGSLSQMHHIPNYYYIIFIIALLIGCVLGFIRSKFYTYSKDKLGNLVYKRDLTDAIILIVYIILEGSLRFIFQSYEANLFTLVNISLLFVAVASISVRRIIMLTNYYNHIKTKDII